MQQRQGVHGPLCLAAALLLGSCSTDRVAEAQKHNLALLRTTGVLAATDKVIFQRTMSYRAGEADDSPIGGYLTRVEVTLPDTSLATDAVQAHLEARALAGDFVKTLAAKQGGLQPACYRGHGVQLCIQVAGLDDPTATAELSVDTHPTE